MLYRLLLGEQIIITELVSVLTKHRGDFQNRLISLHIFQQNLSLIWLNNVEYNTGIS